MTDNPNNEVICLTCTFNNITTTNVATENMSSNIVKFETEVESLNHYNNNPDHLIIQVDNYKGILNGIIR